MSLRFIGIFQMYCAHICVARLSRVKIIKTEKMSDFSFAHYPLKNDLISKKGSNMGPKKCNFLFLFQILNV